LHPPAGAGPSIEEVTVGQLQDNPPICRVTIAASNPLLFKLVSFKTSTGQLVVKWSNNLEAAEEIAAQERAAQRAHHPRQLVPLYGTRTFGPPRRIVQAPQPAATPSVYAANTTPVPPPTVSLTPHAAIATSTSNTTGRPARPASASTPAKRPAVAAKPPVKPAKPAKPAPTTQIADAVPAAKNDNDDLEEPHKGKGLFGRLHQLFGADDNDDRDSHDKLTSSEPELHQASQTPISMKVHQPGQQSAAVDNSNNLNVKFLPPQPADAPVAAVLLPPATKTASRPLHPAPNVPPLKLNITNDESSVIENLKIELAAQHKLTYRCFRMHEPERYVIDFESLPELTKLDLPESDSPLFYRFRTGLLPDHPNITRLVLDLPDEQVTIKDNYDTDKNALTLMLYQQVEQKAETAWSLPPLGELKMPGVKTIVLDAGHGGSDPGAQRGDVQEKDLTLGITEKLKQLLEASGAHVIMTRSDDTFVSLEDRVKTTNQLMPDLFLSVHINALESVSDIHGIETYYQTDQSRSLADAVHQSLVAALSAPDRSVRKARFYVINHTPVPAVLAEVGFISNKDERSKLASTDYQQQVAQALAQGVMVYLTKAPDSPTGSKIAQSKAATPSAGTTGPASGSSASKQTRSVSSTGRITR
ncbi:MAG TPA: N-acetylmuramoyl-L-alanine amidase, partial [Trichormus sp.]